MIRLNFDKLETILCLGAHSDDLEIGCGGTLLTLLNERPGLRVHWVVFSAVDDRAAEATASADELLRAATKQITLYRFRDTCFPFVGQDIKEVFLRLAREVEPDLIFTHRREDLHQDHRLIGELTWNAFRNHLIWEYEIPKYEGDWGAVNCFVPLAEQVSRQKIDHLLKHFSSQHGKPWYNAGVFEAVLRLRGMECRCDSKLAEAFYCRKCVVR